MSSFSILLKAENISTFPSAQVISTISKSGDIFQKQIRIYHAETITVFNTDLPNQKQVQNLQTVQKVFSLTKPDLSQLYSGN